MKWALTIILLLIAGCKPVPPKPAPPPVRIPKVFQAHKPSPTPTPRGQKVTRTAQEPDQIARWTNATINPHYSIALDIDVSLYKRLAQRYQTITDMRASGVPANVIFCLHQRESSGNFRCHPHEGSPLTGRTRYVPKGRLPHPDPPYTFEQSAADAYYVCDRLDLVNWHGTQEALQGIESFNGLGYQKYHPDVPSPYLWNGLLINGTATRGKYTGDGKFDSNAIDQQLGCAAILMRLAQQGVSVPWDEP